MNTRLLKIKVSLSSSAKVLSRPAYVLLALLGTIMASGLILWSLNLELVMYIIFEAPISAVDKLDFFFDVYKGIYTTYNGIHGTGIVVFSVLFGINLALLVFVLRKRGFSSIPKKSGAGGFAFAIIGGGCIACGTSIIAPLIASAGAASAVLVQDLGSVLNWLGSLLIAYSIYKLGTVSSYIFASNDLTKP